MCADNLIWQHLPEPNADEAALGAELVNEYRACGYIARTPAALIQLPDGVMTHFYRDLAADRSTSGPKRGQSNSQWMADADFCFLNVRATGTNGQHGHFIQAAKILPGLRVSAIHLAPFTEHEENGLYAVRCTHTLSSEVLHPNLKLCPEDQLRAFVQAAHLLGLAVGFDMEPHVSQFARTVLMNPEYFRWIKLTPKQHKLAYGCTPDSIMDEAMQAKIIAEVRRIVARYLKKYDLEDIRQRQEDAAALRKNRDKAYFAARKALKESGYWTVPVQYWAGQGIPAFKRYDAEKDYAVFEYCDENDQPAEMSDYQVITPFKFYAGVGVNRTLRRTRPLMDVWNAYVDLFIHWRDQFDFDFVRYDSLDHIFDSVQADGQPSSDAPTPNVLRHAIAEMKQPNRPDVGQFAERIENEVENYADLGFDVMLGNDMFEFMDPKHLEKSFWLNERLSAFNNGREQRYSIVFGIDTHDTGDPGFLGEPMVKLAGPAQMKLRHFVARFASAGKGRRPKYEALGSQDMSYGLFEANIKPIPLTWVGDIAYNRHYHWLEQVYTRWRPLLDAGELTLRYVDSTHAVWTVQSVDHWLVAAVSFTGTDPFHYALPGTKTGLPVLTYDFDTLATHASTLHEKGLLVSALPPNTARLWVVGVSVLGETESQ